MKDKFMKSEFIKNIKDTSRQQGSKPITQGFNDFWDDCREASEEQQNWTERAKRKTTKKTNGKKKPIFNRLHEDAIQRKIKKQDAEKKPTEQQMQIRGFPPQQNAGAKCH